MVKAIINITDDANRILNIVKAQYGLKDKSEAIDKMAEDYEQLIFEPQIKASYIKKLEKIRKERVVKIGSMEEFDKRFGLTKK